MRNHDKSFTMGIVACGMLLFVGVGVAYGGQPIKADEMGLSKGSVFDTPVPMVYHESASQPGQSNLLPRAYLGAPPQIPHDVAAFLPITAQSNLCIACHNLPDQWGKKLVKGAATPIPPSHYTDLRNSPGKVGGSLVNARFTCNQCHVPQTDAPALVENTFSTSRKH